jgi:hypothetical protein
VGALLSFPNPVNETSVRLVAAGVAVTAAATIAFQQPWLLVALAYGFVARALAGPTLSPLALLATRVVTPRLRVEHRYAPGPAKRFSQAVGAVVTVTAALLYFAAGLHTAAYALAGLILAFALLESVGGICVGCMVFQLLMRLRVIPPEVCADCADIWARQRV